ncbi:hypothetical protein [Vibrio comitans]|uniref:hypothetical protein n=1 Tax=Vibrio comitans TaxID=413401 RepID=UPI001143DB89|nr:hypothetical protein [Vibrio comitans]
MQYLITLFLFLSFSVCAELHTPNLSAKYEIRDQLGFQVNRSELIFSIFEGHVVREVPEQNIIEHWVQRKDGRHVFYRHFPSHRKSLYYNRGDLRALSLASSWEQVSEVIPSVWLQSLNLKELKDSEFGEVEVYQGTIGEFEVEIDWLKSQSIPYRYSIRKQYQRLTLQLTEFDSSSNISQKLSEWDSYQSIDFSDAMDMERDTFVQYLMSSGQLNTNGLGLHQH